MNKIGWIINLLLVVGVCCAQDQEQAISEIRRYESKAEKNEEDFFLASVTESPHSGISHFYFQQRIHGYPVRAGHAGVHFSEEGELVHLTYEPQRLKSVTAVAPIITEQRAITLVKNSYPLSQQLVPHDLAYVVDEEGVGRLAFGIMGKEEDGTWFLASVDAVTATLFDFSTLSADCHPNEVPPESLEGASLSQTSIPAAGLNQPFPGQYHVFALPAESPLLATRELVTAGQLVDPIASPFGWHDTDGDASTPEFFYTKGNNVYTYYATPPISDPNAVPILRDPVSGTFLGGNVPWPAGNTLDFNYQNDINQPDGTAFVEDAVTNLFVAVNQTHDIFYRYGFDEGSGNFQSINHGGAGLGGDAILARAQDGGGINQASFSTPPDGMAPTMRMHLWNTNQPNSARDGSFENSIIVHEFGHGVAFRLIQGPSVVNCLNNFEQGGEGWSDFFGLMLTQNDYDGNGQIDRHTLGEGVRGIGHFVLNRSTSESGLRPRHYTSNMDPAAGLHNEYTYADLPALGFPHTTGFLWATMLWDINLDLMEEYGFESDLSNASSTAGNVRAMHLVVEGLKMTPCNPTFIDMRDAILAADQALYGGANQRLLWRAFARRGLGLSAAPAGQAAFDRPELMVEVNRSADEIFVGDNLNYSLVVTNGDNQNQIPGRLVAELDDAWQFVSAPTGNHQNGTVTFSNLGLIASGQSKTRNINLAYPAGPATEILVDLPVETDDLPNFIPAGAWIPVTDFPNPNTNSTQSWFHLASGTAVESSLIFTLDLPSGTNNHLSFWHDFDLETGLDGGVLEMLQGGEWVDLGDRFLSSPYRYVIRDDLITPVGVPLPFTTLTRRRAWSGSSQGYERCIVDLSDFGSSSLTLRFRFASNTGTDVAACDTEPAGCDGWFIDDIQLLDLVNIRQTACLNDQLPPVCGDDGRLGVIVWPNPDFLPYVNLDLRLTAAPDHLALEWATSKISPDINLKLERSTGGTNAFKEVSSSVQSGRFTDYSAQPNRDYYYRIYGEDENGLSYFSRVVVGRIDRERSLSISPNPGPGIFWVSWDHFATPPQRIELYATDGPLVYQKQLDGGTNACTIDVSRLSSGVYYLRLINDREVSSKKIVVQ